MISGYSTNALYYSELLEIKYPKPFKELSEILNKHNIKHKSLKATKDIWCRDYMPVQTEINKFIQFRYEPSYLRDNLELQSNPKEVCNANILSPTFSSINLDGGNIVNCNNKAIITDRIFTENTEYTNRVKLVSDIETLLQVEVIIIPQINTDMTGHSDGLVRFIDQNKILGNNRRQELKYWSNKMNKVLKEHDLEYVDIPFFEYKNKSHPENAIGCYINFLEIQNLIILPIFETQGNKDKEVFNLFQDLYPKKIIETIKINEIGLQGGLLNCITWTIQE